MKIAILRSDLDTRCGGARQVIYLTKELVKMGHDVTLFCYSYNYLECFPELVTDIPIRYVIKDGDYRKTHNFKKSNIELFSDIKKVYSYYAKMKRLAGLLVERFDVINPHEWLAHRAAYIARQRIGTPIVWMCNDPSRWNPGAPDDKNRIRWNILSNMFGKIDQSIIGSFEKIVVLDRRMKRIVDQSYGMDSIIVRSGIDLERFEEVPNQEYARQKHNLPIEGVIILSVGILFNHRRFEDVIEAIYLLKNEGIRLYYVIVGIPDFSNNYASFLEDTVNNKGLRDCVFFVKKSVADKELIELYAACDIFVFPNENQTWGLAAVEAMALGKPAIVSTGAGIHEVLEDHKTAILVPPRSPVLIAKAIKRLITDNHFQFQIQSAGTAYVKGNLSWTCYAESMVRVFEMVINSGHN
jgi:glycosyltransferase involved in cell wall biosynthesis